MRTRTSPILLSASHRNSPPHSNHTSIPIFTAPLSASPLLPRHSHSPCCLLLPALDSRRQLSLSLLGRCQLLSQPLNSWTAAFEQSDSFYQPSAVSPGIGSASSNYPTTSFRYNAIIMEALTVLQEPNGSDIGALYKYIEQRMEIPSGFRRLLGSKLRRLVAQNKIEKGSRGYQLKDPSFGIKTPMPKQKDPANRLKPLQSSDFNSKAIDPVEEAAASAAYKIADAEAKAYMASEAVREAEKISKMAEETESMLMLAKEVYENCVHGEIVTMA